MDKTQILLEESNMVKIMPDGRGFIGIVYDPDTGKELEKFYSGSERGVRMQLIKYIYSTVPVGYEKY